MRVLFSVGSLGTGGLERFVTRTALRAKRGGELDPVVLCLHRRKGEFVEPLEAAEVEVHEAPKNWQRRPSQLHALSRLIRRIGPDIVHSQVNFSLGQQYLACLMAGVRTFSVTERNCYPLQGAGLARRLIQFHGLRLLGVSYSANAPAVATHLAKQVRVPLESIPVFPNGVEDIEPDPTIRSRVREELGWAPEDLGVGYIARMAKHKGQASFLRAISRLRTEDGLSVKACLLGDGPERSGLEALARDLELNGAVTFCGRVTNVEDYLQGFDAVALFSDWEGMPNAVIEAMAAGRAVVASRAGAVPELLDNGRAGVLADATTVEGLSDALGGLLSDQKRMTELGERARKRVLEQFGLERSFGRLLEHYEQEQEQQTGVARA